MGPRSEVKTAIVAGGSRKNGLAIAPQLVEEGARVVVTRGDPSALDRSVAGLGGPEHAFGFAGRADDTDH